MGLSWINVRNEGANYELLIDPLKVLLSLVVLAKCPLILIGALKDR